MILRIVLAALMAVSIVAAGLYWDRGRLSDKLEVTEERLHAAEVDAATKSETLNVLRAHNSRLSDITTEQSDREQAIRNSEGFDDEVPAIILDTISNLGLR